MTTSTYNAGGQLIGTDASGTLTTYTYDASGNLSTEVTNAGTRSYTWDYDDRLTELENPDSSTVAFAYNAAGRLSGRTETSAEDSTTVEGRLYDGDKLVITKDGDGNTQVRYTTQGPAPYSDVISQRQNNQTYYYMLDGIHNVYQVVDSLLAIRNTYDYDWFRYMTQRKEEIRNDYHVSLWTTLYLDYSLYQAEQLCYQALYGRNIQMPFNNARFTSLLYPEFGARDAGLSLTPMPTSLAPDHFRRTSTFGCFMAYNRCIVDVKSASCSLSRDIGWTDLPVSDPWTTVGCGIACAGVAWFAHSTDVWSTCVSLCLLAASGGSYSILSSSDQATSILRETCIIAYSHCMTRTVDTPEANTFDMPPPEGGWGRWNPWKMTNWHILTRTDRYLP